jgi:hypothetical protein
MAFMVIHLWGKFWMAVWRGRRAMTWITGAIAFAASVTECFTGYLAQQNFDSQWIATNGKDAFNAVGIWRLLQRDGLRPDAAVARRLLPSCSSPWWERTSCWSGCAGQPPAARPADPVADRAARKAAAAADAAPWTGPTRR